MSEKIKVEENLDEIIKNVVKDIKKNKSLSTQEIDKLMNDANENIEFTKVISDIKLESPDNRVIFVDGNEQLMYDHGEFFICDTVDSRKLKKKIKRKEATERYIEYFIRYQLNPIIEQKNMYNISKTITKNENEKSVVSKVKTVEKGVDKKIDVKPKAEVKQKNETEKVKVTSKKVKDDLTR